MEVLVENYLGHKIIKNNDGIVVSDSKGCNPMPGACSFADEMDAKIGIINWIIASHFEFSGSNYWRLYGRKPQGDLNRLISWAKQRNLKLQEEFDAYAEKNKLNPISAYLRQID